MCEFLTPTPKGQSPGSTAQFTRSRSPRRAQAFHCFPVSLAASGEVARLVQQRKLAIPRIERQRKQIMMIPGAALKLQNALWNALQNTVHLKQPLHRKERSCSLCRLWWRVVHSTGTLTPGGADHDDVHFKQHLRHLRAGALLPRLHPWWRGARKADWHIPAPQATPRG